MPSPRGRFPARRRAAIRRPLRDFAPCLLLALTPVLQPLGAEPLHAQPAQEIGVVIDRGGLWLRGETAVGPGDPLLRSDTLRLADDGLGFGHITLLLADARHVRYECVLPCEPFVPHDSLAVASLVERGVRAVARLSRLLRAAPSPMVVGLARGVDGTAVETALAPSDSGLDLAPALAELVSGRYYLSIRPVETSTPDAPLDPDAEPGSPMDRATAELVWQPDGPPATIPADELPPGLYELTVTDVNRPPGDPAPPAWILVVADQEQLTRAAAELDEARSLAATWARADERELRAYLRAVLFDLASQL